jgi:hypothetical protein
MECDPRDEPDIDAQEAGLAGRRRCEAVRDMGGMNLNP